MPKQYSSVRDMQSDVDRLAIGEVVHVAGRAARVIGGTFSKTIKFIATTSIDMLAMRPDDGRKFNSSKYGKSAQDKE
jgi:hypothetical protein